MMQPIPPGAINIHFNVGVLFVNVFHCLQFAIETCSSKGAFLNIIFEDLQYLKLLSTAVWGSEEPNENYFDNVNTDITLNIVL